MTASPRVALVTGGAGAIGAAVCRALAAQGRTVAVADLDGEGAALLAAEIGGLGVALDVARPRFGRPRARRGARRGSARSTVLVSCAGWDVMRPFVETDEPFQARVLEINLGGPIRVARAVLPDMIERGVRPHRAGRVGRGARRLFGRSDLRGGEGRPASRSRSRSRARWCATASPRTACARARPTRRCSAASPKRPTTATASPKRSTRAIPMRRLGRPDDVAPAVAFLASDAAGLHHGPDAFGERRPHDELRGRRSPDTERGVRSRGSERILSRTRGAPVGR